MDASVEVCYNERMGKKDMLVIGVMSGTSADGIDVALARVSGGGKTRVRGELQAHATFPLPKEVRRAILRVAEGGATTAREISQLNFRLGLEFGDSVVRVC